jgi:hypothetical protein
MRSGWSEHTRETDMALLYLLLGLVTFLLLVGLALVVGRA